MSILIHRKVMSHQPFKRRSFNERYRSFWRGLKKLFYKKRVCVILQALKPEAAASKAVHGLASGEQSPALLSSSGFSVRVNASGVKPTCFSIQKIALIVSRCVLRNRSILVFFSKHGSQRQIPFAGADRRLPALSPRSESLCREKMSDSKHAVLWATNPETCLWGGSVNG